MASRKLGLIFTTGLLLSLLTISTSLGNALDLKVVYVAKTDTDFSKVASADQATVSKTTYLGDAQIDLKYYKNVSTTLAYDCDCTTDTVTSVNSSKSDVTTCKTCYKTEYTQVLTPVDASTVLKEGQPIYETFGGCTNIGWNGKSWGCSVWTDVNILGEKIEGATWFNASFGARVAINFTNIDNKTHIQEPVNITIASTGNTSIRNCINEIAFTNYTNNATYPLSLIQLIEDNLPSCKYMILINISANFNGPLVYAYYNASGFNQSLGTIQLFSDNFDDGVKTNIWTDTTGDTEADGFAKLADADATRLDTNDNATWNPTLYGGLTVYFRANTSSTTYTGVWNTLIDTGSYGSTNSSGITDGVATGGVLDYQVYIGNVGSQADLAGFTLGKGKLNYYVVQTNVSTAGGYQFVRSWGDSHSEIVGTSAQKAWVKWTSARLHSQGNNNIAGWYDFVELYRGIVNFYEKSTNSTMWTVEYAPAEEPEEPEEPTPIVIPSGVSRMYCDGSNLLVDTKIITKIVNGTNSSSNFENTTEVTYCNWGCDNVTMSCSPNNFTRSTWFGGAILALLIIIGLIMKLWRGR